MAAVLLGRDAAAQRKKKECGECKLKIANWILWSFGGYLHLRSSPHYDLSLVLPDPFTPNEALIHCP
jgi:hypothetical protein